MIDGCLCELSQEPGPRRPRNRAIRSSRSARSLDTLVLSVSLFRCGFGATRQVLPLSSDYPECDPDRRRPPRRATTQSSRGLQTASARWADQAGGPATKPKVTGSNPVGRASTGARNAPWHSGFTVSRTLSSSGVETTENGKPHGHAERNHRATTTQWASGSRLWEIGQEALRPSGGRKVAGSNPVAPISARVQTRPASRIASSRPRLRLCPVRQERHS